MTVSAEFLRVSRHARAKAAVSVVTLCMTAGVCHAGSDMVDSLALTRSAVAIPNISAVTWSPDGRLAATAHNASLNVSIWDAQKLKVVKELKLTSKGFGLRNVAFSPDGRFLAAGLKTVTLWTTNDWQRSGELIAPHMDPTVPQFGGIQSIAFNLDGRLLAVAYGGAKALVIGYDIPAGTVRWSFDVSGVFGPSVIGTEIAFVPDGQRLLFGMGQVGRDAEGRPARLSRIVILASATGVLDASIDGIHVDHPTALAISPDGTWAVSGTSSGAVTQTADFEAKRRTTRENRDPVRIWDLASRRLIKELPVHSRVWALVVTKDGKHILASRSDAGGQRTLVAWAVDSGAVVRELESPKVSLGLALSPRGDQLLGAAGNELLLFSVR